MAVPPLHSPTVGCILRPNTGYVSPQYHVVYDELFSSVASITHDHPISVRLWTQMLRLGGHERTLDDTDVHGSTVPFQEFYENFLDEDDSEEIGRAHV